LPGGVDRYARRSERLTQSVTRGACALSGQAGARLPGRLGVPRRGGTLLSHIRAHPIGGRATPRVLSVDAASMRRGRSDGTILVELEPQQVVALVPARTASPLATWLVADQPQARTARGADG
jgi:hypothetical protein